MKLLFGSKKLQLLSACLPVVIAMGCGSASTNSTNTASTAKNTTASTASGDNVAVVKALYKAYNERDTANIGSLYANNYVEYGDGTYPAKTYPAPDSLVIEFKEQLKIVPDAHTGNEEYFTGDSDKVIVVSTNTGTWTGAAVKGQKATGKSFKYDDADIYTLKDGKITAHKNIYPSKAIGAQVGFIYANR